VLAVGARLILIAVAAADVVPVAAPAAPATIPLRSGRTTTVVVGIEVGAPLERAFPSAAYARAAAADAEERWDDAQPLYRQAIAEWTAISRTRPSRALELAIAKAEHELHASQTLAISGRNPRPVDKGGRIVDDTRRMWERNQALEEGRRFAAKLLATRATLGRVSALLYTHTRDRLEAARDAGPRPSGGVGVGVGVGSNAEVQLLLCAVYAAGDATADARLARARVTEAERSDPANTLAVAACAAALAETEAAIRALEIFVLRPLPLRPDRFLHDIYLSNDWDHLRGNPRFESLFPR